MYRSGQRTWTGILTGGALESIAVALVELGVSRLVAVHFPAGCVAAGCMRRCRSRRVFGWGVCVAAASLEGAATSDGVQPLAKRLVLGDDKGYRST